MQGFGFGIWGCVVFIVRLVAAVVVVCTEFATVVGENSVAGVVIVVVSL